MAARQELSISVCTYKDGSFEVILKDPATGEEIDLFGHQKIDAKQFELLDRLAPACVFTKYSRDAG